MRADKNLSPDYEIGVFLLKLCGGERLSEFQKKNSRFRFGSVFFFLWLRFFLFGRSKKKEMNKTAYYTTGYFAYAQYDVLKYRHSANCLALRQRRNGTNRVLEDSSLTLNMTPRHPAGAGEGLFQRDISLHSERTANPRRDAAFLEKLSFVTI